MTFFAPLWADGDWARLVVPIVMFTIWVLSRMMGAESPAAKQAKARQQARVNPPQPPEQKQRVEDEVGEFLRRAAQQRSGKENRPPPTDKPPQPPTPVRRPLADTAASRSRGSPPKAQEAADAPVRSRVLSASSDESPSPGKLAERMVQPVEVAQSDAAMQSHLQQAFGHQVGSMQASASMTDTAAVNSPPAPVAEVAAMLRDPQSIRQSIIISEILRRPEERW